MRENEKPRAKGAHGQGCFTGLTVHLQLVCEIKGFAIKGPQKGRCGNKMGLWLTEEGALQGRAYQGELAEAARLRNNVGHERPSCERWKPALRSSHPWGVE